jgi:hypothetical protein
MVTPLGPNEQPGTCQACGRPVDAGKGTVYAVEEGSGPGRHVLVHSRQRDCEGRP